MNVFFFFNEPKPTRFHEPLQLVTFVRHHMMAKIITAPRPQQVPDIELIAGFPKQSHRCRVVRDVDPQQAAAAKDTGAFR
jgi:hypothetical protein